MHKTLIYIIAFFFLISCQKQEDNRCFKTIGEIVTETRNVTDFDTLEVSGYIHYQLIEDTINKIEITAGKNIQQFITTDCSNKRLIIQNKNMCNFLRNYKKNTIQVKIHFKQLNKLIYSGALKLESLGIITQQYLRLDCWDGNGEIKLNINNYLLETYLFTGSANLYISGKSTARYIYSESSSFIYDINYKTETYHVNHDGTGNYHLDEANSIDLKMQNIGDVYYKGTPNFINKNINGKGKLIKEDV